MAPRFAGREPPWAVPTLLGPPPSLHICTRCFPPGLPPPSDCTTDSSHCFCPSCSGQPFWTSRRAVCHRHRRGVGAWGLAHTTSPTQRALMAGAGPRACILPGPGYAGAAWGRLLQHGQAGPLCAHLGPMSLAGMGGITTPSLRTGRGLTPRAEVGGGPRLGRRSRWGVGHPHPDFQHRPSLLTQGRSSHRLRPWAGGRCLDCPPSCLPALPAGWLPGFGSWHPRCFTQNGHGRVLQVGSEQRACARREGLHQRALGERARAWVPRPDPCRKRAHVLGLALGSLA